jgi:hypothetical protein
MSNSKPAIHLARHEVITALGAGIKEVFITEMRKKQILAARPPNYRVGDRWDWDKIADFLLKRKLPVGPWVRYVVQYSNRTQPNHLYSAKIYDTYLETIDDREQETLDEMEQEFAGFKSTVKVQLQNVLDAVEDGDAETMSEEDVVCSVLCDSVQPLSWLFRYCWAADRGMQDLMDEYLPAAACEYLFAPDYYDQVWKGWLPVEFTRMVRRTIGQ